MPKTDDHQPKITKDIVKTEAERRELAEALRRMARLLQEKHDEEWLYTIGAWAALLWLSDDLPEMEFLNFKVALRDYRKHTN